MAQISFAFQMLPLGQSQECMKFTEVFLSLCPPYRRDINHSRTAAILPACANTHAVVLDSE